MTERPNHLSSKPDDEANLLARIYLRILEWPDLEQEAKPTGGSADLADDKANPQRDDGELTYE